MKPTRFRKSRFGGGLAQPNMPIGKAMMVEMLNLLYSVTFPAHPASNTEAEGKSGEGDE